MKYIIVCLFLLQSCASFVGGDIAPKNEKSEICNFKLHYQSSEFISDRYEAFYNRETYNLNKDNKIGKNFALYDKFFYGVEKSLEKKFSCKKVNILNEHQGADDYYLISFKYAEHNSKKFEYWVYASWFTLGIIPFWDFPTLDANVKLYKKGKLAYTGEYNEKVFYLQHLLMLPASFFLTIQKGMTGLRDNIFAKIKDDLN